ncbi:protein FAM178B isoform X7 [Canis lupus familiaris]|uniref:protein FAM178B isoform X7 n=1 Tax=Canis lupus familiaris TaxID=9615 RepID=UPI0006B3DBE5|nr:protein FAM178B isoform X7 [Canis lupus familiaris]XP_025320592.1 protein FAM178B isoform X7 [Canis lupus dingo]XP_038407035.1 protein FAM178B isoform X7 [Canis lupus familiaris]XP_038536320.1 protein FAM178B isoform X7 [Canis lupus familiaris]|eukprot:XP_022280349.1 protein FAM178B isoform X8 [Canis lupus familiaris]
MWSSACCPRPIFSSFCSCSFRTSRSGQGRQLRSQLSLVIIAQMLDQQEMLPLWEEKAQLSSLSQLLTLMKPSSLRQYLGSETLPPCREQQPKASAELDHKVCYLCYSLLTLAGVVVSCQDITPDQWGDLQLLCLQLDRHVSTHIRESPQAMHWTRLKDLAAQTYIRWQELLAHCQPQAQYFNPWKDNSLRLLAEAGSEQGSRNRRKQRTEARGGPV